jgi:hypothetical protein
MIKKDWTVPSSAALATVHVVSQAQLDFSGSNTLTATVSSFVDADAYNAGRTALFVQSVPIDGLPASGEDVLAYVEARLTEAAPEGVVSQYTFRYALAGGEVIQESPSPAEPAATS